MRKSLLFVSLLSLTLAFSIFIRTYRIQDFLGFWYDQGRDALVVWDLIHYGNFFLIGPTTGIEGIFLGPFFYYLLTPFYWIGKGDPVIPSIAISVINVFGICLIFLIGKKYFDRNTGLVASILISFSFPLILAHRWLSNPTPLPMFSALVFLSLLKVTEGKNNWWWLLGLATGLSLQLEAASAIFFLPAIFICLALNRKQLTGKPVHVVVGILFFTFTLLPQIIFDFRNDHLITKAFHRFLVSEKSFQINITDFYIIRIKDYFEIFTNKFLKGQTLQFLFLMFTLLFALLTQNKIPKRQFNILLIWVLLPPLSLLFYHGNNGFVWDYYFTGIFSFWALLIALIWVSAYKYFKFARPIVAIFFALFFYHNLLDVKTYFSNPLPAIITLTPINQTIDWVYKDSLGMPFNVDVYVPPVISYSYSYVFVWRGTNLHNQLPKEQLTSKLYTIHEPDLEHPQFLSRWLDRQKGIGKVEESKKFGQITVERRSRLGATTP